MKTTSIDKKQVVTMATVLYVHTREEVPSDQ